MTEAQAPTLDLAFWINTGILILTLVAIVLGPIAAVIVSRMGEDRRRRRNSQLEIFRALMKTRRVRINAEHVWALNLIELEFYGKDSIIQAYRSYMKTLNSPYPKETGDGLETAFFDEQSDLYNELLQLIGKELGYQLDKRDLDKTGYAPVGWQNDEELQRRNAVLFNEILQGRRALPIAPLAAPINSPFPPPPKGQG